MSPLVAVERGLKATYVDGFHYAALMPVGVSGRKDGEVLWAEVM